MNNPPPDEAAHQDGLLGERLAEAAAGMCARAERRKVSRSDLLTVEGDVDDPRTSIGYNTQVEQ